MLISPKLQKIPFIKPILFLGLLSVFGSILLLIRIFYFSDPYYWFLWWNLFLGAIPYFLSSMLFYAYFYHPIKKLWLYFLFALWLLFFPNALYIITDFIHLRPRGEIPLWFDLILVLTFAWVGMMAGFFSLRSIHLSLDKFFNKRIAWILIVLLLGISSFGIYLGRFLRWNSWDMFIHPITVLSDIFQRVIHPFSYPGMYAMTIVFWAFFLFTYFTVISITSTTEAKSKPAQYRKK